MSEGHLPDIAVGDEVRVHYHPSQLTRNFVEGIVSRIQVETLRGRVFVLDASYEVIHDREQPLKPGYRNYILYERWDDFPGRIEILEKAETTPESPGEEVPDQHHVEVERDDARAPTTILAALFRRRT